MLGIYRMVQILGAFRVVLSSIEIVSLVSYIVSINHKF
jgi:hypothetical protein